MTPGDALGEPDAEGLDAATLERSAVRGVSLLFVRSIVLLAITAGATIVIARLLSPPDYGAFALAFAVQLVGRTVVELGLPTAFIRRAAAPTVAEQRALTGILLLLGTIVAALAAAIAFVALPLAGVDNRIGALIAVACFSLPLLSLRAVPFVLIQRELRFGRVIVIEATETLSFYAFALPSAAAGLGAWSLVGAVPISAGVGAIAASLVQRWGFGLSLEFAALRPMLRFGAQAAALTPITFGREAGLVGVLAVAGGQALSGFYAMSQRLFAVPVVFASAINRVGIPALSQDARDEDRRHRVARAGAAITVAAALPVAVIAGAADSLITVLFGSKWVPTADVVLFASPGVMLNAGIGSFLAALALADGDARSPLLAFTVGAVVSLGLSVVLAAPLGTEGAGIAAGAGLVLSTVILIARTSAHRLTCTEAAIRTVLVAAAAAGAGRLVPGGEDVPALLGALAASGAVWLALSALLTRAELGLLVRLSRRHLLPARWAPAADEAAAGS